MAAFHMEIIMIRVSMIFYPENHGNDTPAAAGVQSATAIGGS